MFDVIIIGGGPAGLTAALYIRRAGKSVLVIEKNTYGGQITWSEKIENFPAIKSLSGMEFADKLLEQVMEYNAELELDEVVSVNQLEDETFEVKTAFGETFKGKTIIISTGAKPRMLGLDREDEFVGSGISYCAICDGEFFKDKVVAVNGGGNTAVQEAIYLSQICKKVYLIHRRDEFRADESLVTTLKEYNNIIFELSSNITELIGDDSLNSIMVNGKSGEKKIDIDGLFIAIGHVPDNDMLSQYIDLNNEGYVDSAENCETKQSRIFVAGDCREKNIRQLTTAISDGTVAGLAACSFLDKNA